MSEPTLRVAHIYKDFAPVVGGIEGHLALLTRLLRTRGVASEVLCARRAGLAAHEIRDTVHVHRSRSPLELASSPLPPGLPLAVARSPASLLHVHCPWPPGAVAALLGRRRRPLVATFHCEVLRYPGLEWAQRPLERRLLDAAAVVLVTSPALREAPALVSVRERVRVVPYGVDLERFRPDASAPDPLPAVPRPRVLFSGRLRHYKGLPILARALAMLPDVQLVVVGDGPERAAFETALRENGVAQRVHWPGEQDAEGVARLLRSVDVLALPSTSRAEAFGIAAAEAQASGVPVVTTELGTGTHLVVDDGVSGRVVAPADPGALAEALRWCLDPHRAPALSRAARAHATQKLDAERMTDAIASVYSELLD